MPECVDGERTQWLVQPVEIKKKHLKKSRSMKYSSSVCSVCCCCCDGASDSGEKKNNYREQGSGLRFYLMV